MRLLLLLTIILASCKAEKVKQENIRVKLESFNVDSAYYYIEKQVGFGERHMNTKAHEECKEWLIDKLKQYNFEVISQNFEAKSYLGETLHGTNIIGRHNPNVEERILLCAHYDTRHIADKDTLNKNQPILGADDGGSGVGVLLEIARMIDRNPIPMGLDIIFFDAEDYGDQKGASDYSWGLGSQYWSKNQHETPYFVKYGVLLDMVGAKNATFPKEGYSMQSAGEKVNQIWNFASKLGHGKSFVQNHVGFYTDDHRFIIENSAIPMIDIINIKKNGHFGDHHHTHSDNMNLIDKTTLKAVGQTVVAVIYHESNKTRF